MRSTFVEEFFKPTQLPKSNPPIYTTTGPNPEKRLLEAALLPDEQEIKRLVEEEHLPVTAKDVHWRTAAHLSAAIANMPVLRYVMSKEPKLVSALDRYKQTPLLAAVEKGALEAVVYLVDNCNADVFQRVGLRGRNNALHVAAEEGQFEILRYLIEEKKMDPNEPNSWGQTAVLLAARDDHLEIVKYLTENANASLTVSDFDDRNILYMAASSLNGSLRVPKYVLDERNVTIDVNHRDRKGMTVTHLACRFFYFDMIKYYVEEKHADVNLVDTENRTALHLASKMANSQLVDYLLDHGADASIKDIFGLDAEERKSNSATYDLRVDESLKAHREARARRSLARPLLDWASDLMRPLAPWIPAEQRSADSYAGGRVRRAAGEFSPANGLLLLANALFKTNKRRIPLPRHAVIDGNAHSVALDAIQSDAFN